MIGEVVGGYRVIGQLGEGGMGVVYLAEHTIMGRKAAVKILHPKLSSDREMVQRFFNEARAAGAISHPGIVSVFDLGRRDDGSAFIIMDYLEGESLAARLHRRGRLSGHEALSITRQILSALSAAHAKGIVHRDLKPDNIFLVPDAEVEGGERIKLLDFGIAKLQHDGGANVLTTRAGAILGTPVYMSPEQCRGAGECDQRTDLYAVGVMLFELLTGQPPFTGSAAGDLMAAHIRDAPPSLSEKLGPTSVALENIVSTLLAKSPDDRFPSGEMAIARIDLATHSMDSLGSSQHARPTEPMSGDLPTNPTLPLQLDPMAQTAMGAQPMANTKSTTLRNTAGSVDVSQVRETAPSRRGLWLGGGVLAIAALGVLFVVLRPSALSSSAPSSATPTPLGQLAPREDARLADAATLETQTLETQTLKAQTPRANALPAVDLALVSDDATFKAKRLHKRALELHRAEAFEDAFAAYTGAIAADPGHILARYNYACLLNLAGEVHEGLAILAQLKDAGCSVCLGRLVRARSDSEWKSSWKRPDFQKLTGDIMLEQPSTNETGQLVAQAFATGDIQTLDALFAPRAAISIRSRSPLCKGRSCMSKSKVIGLKATQAALAELGTISVSKRQSCNNGCCTYRAVTPSEAYLHRVCSKVDSGSVRTLTSLEFVVAQ